jgi:hypothetical protein
MLMGTGALLVFAFAIKAVDKSGMTLPLLGALDIPAIDKTALEPLRLLHFLVSMLFVIHAMPREAAAQRSLPMRSVARVGQFSLECFCMSTIIVYASIGLLMNAASITTWSVLLAGIALVVLICLFAVFMAWIRSEPWRGERAKKPAPPVHDVVESASSLTGGAVRFATAGNTEGR